MTTNAEEIAHEAKLMRKSGHEIEGLILVKEAKQIWPESRALDTELEKCSASAHPNETIARCQETVGRAVDVLGVPAVILISILVAVLLGPILFVEAG